MNTIKEIEDCMADIATSLPDLGKLRNEIERLLKVMGNVDGDEILLLHIVAMANIGISIPTKKE